MFKVDIYIELDKNDEKTRYRMYGAKVVFKTENNGPVTREIYGTEKASRDRIMLIAFISALNILTKPCEATVHMYCPYVTENIRQGNMYKWFANGWKGVRNDPIKYREEWQQVIHLVKRHELVFDVKKEHAYSSEMRRCIKERIDSGIEYRQQALGQ